VAQTLQILYHGNCFDGVASAAIFWRFFRDREGAPLEVTFRAMGHGQGDPYGEDHAATFHADVNAVLDFRYSPSPRLDWWCDHHHSTFIEPAHRDHFEAHPSPRHRFDPAAPSCAGLLAGWLREGHGLDTSPFGELIRWADLIDSARFDSPAQAVELAEPPLQLMALLDSAPGDALVRTMLEGLATGDLAGVHRLPEIRRALEPVLEANRRAVELFRRRMELRDGVAYVDLAADGVDGFNKFIPYHLADGVRYTVVLTSSARRAKVSVGSNPWRRPQPLTNIADLCARYGGGGHPVVGAVTLPPAEVERARQISLEIAAGLHNA
jgi:hypothetical protein